MNVSCRHYINSISASRCQRAAEAAHRCQAPHKIAVRRESAILDFLVTTKRKQQAAPSTLGPGHVLVEVDNRAGHETRPLREEERRDLRHFRRLDEPAERLLLL